ncbi:MAG TPA: hypothetical protein VKU00_24575 [Chthonomonadaceae bacterium]|nr:hypothetical protein [Chthonomonadaceae bacterium]
MNLKTKWTGSLSLLLGLALFGAWSGGYGVGGASSAHAGGFSPMGGPSEGDGGDGSGNENAKLRRVAKLILKPGEGSLYSGVIDPIHGYAYFATSGSVHPGYIIKVALGAGNAAPVEVGAIPLPAGQEGVATSVIDPVHGYAYFGNLQQPARIFKVALEAGNALPRLVGSTVLNASERALFGSGIDIARGYAYFVCAANPGIVVKVALGEGDALPRRVSAAALNPGTGFPRRLLVDPASGYGYVVCNGADASSQWVKLSLGAGDAAPRQVSSVAFPAGENNFHFAALDTEAGYAYLGTYNPRGAFDDTTPGKIVKVRLNPGDAAPVRIGAITVPQKYFTAGGLDPKTHSLYLANDLTFPVSSVLQVATGQGDQLPHLVNTLPLQQGTTPFTFATRPKGVDPLSGGEIYIQSGVIDPAAGYLYFGTDTHPGQIIKVAIPAK